MESAFSEDFKRYFLLTFTRELITHFGERDITKLQSIINIRENKKTNLVKTNLPLKKSEFIRTKQMPDASLLLPEKKLPLHLEYLKPADKKTEGIDFWKVTPFIEDNMIRIIEASPDEKVVVSGAVGSKETDLVLRKEDINRIINKFSELSKIPVNEGIYRVAFGNLALSAIVSEAIGSKFIIKKNILPIQ